MLRYYHFYYVFYWMFLEGLSEQINIKVKLIINIEFLK